MRNKDEQTDGQCRECGHENRAGREILDKSDPGTPFFRDQIHRLFQTGIEHFRHPDQADGHGEGCRFQPGDLYPDRGGHDDQGGGEVDPGIMLPDDKAPDAG